MDKTSLIKILFIGSIVMAQPVVSEAGAKFDQDQARAAVQSGQAMPFASMQARLIKECNCQILEAKLHPENDHGVRFLVYEIKALRPDGGIVKLEMNALSGDILRMKNKGKAD